MNFVTNYLIEGGHFERKPTNCVVPECIPELQNGWNVRRALKVDRGDANNTINEIILSIKYDQRWLLNPLLQNLTFSY